MFSKLSRRTFIQALGAAVIPSQTLKYLLNSNQLKDPRLLAMFKKTPDIVIDPQSPIAREAHFTTDKSTVPKNYQVVRRGTPFKNQFCESCLYWGFTDNKIYEVNGQRTKHCPMLHQYLVPAKGYCIYVNTLTQKQAQQLEKAREELTKSQRKLQELGE